MFELPYYFAANFSLERLVLINPQSNIPEMICVFFFIFGNHTSIFNVFEELDNLTERRIKLLVNYTVRGEIVLSIIVILIGYLSTLENTPEVFIDRPNETIFMIIGKIFYVICLICNIGIYYCMIRPSLEWLLLKRANNKFTKIENLFVSIPLLFFLLLFSFLFDRITDILSIIGSTAQIYLMFIIPIMIYFKAFELSFFKKVMYLILLSIVVSIGWSYLVNILYVYIIDNFYGENKPLSTVII